jgi:hypothetical protein
MKTFIKLVCGVALLASISGVAFAQVHVRGYTRSDGTYVAPYYRTAPDNTINNNYSTYPNVNPYTGQQGTIAPNPYQPLYTPPTPSHNPYATNPYATSPYATP